MAGTVNIASILTVRLDRSTKHLFGPISHGPLAELILYGQVKRRCANYSLPEAMIPDWLTDLSIASLCLAALCGLVIAIDEITHTQRMWIMDIVWPITALFAGPLIVWLYFRYGRQPHGASGGVEKPFSAVAAIGALHCGAGCCLGDMIAEWLCFLVPGIAVAFGFTTLFDDKFYAVWIVDFIFAFALGILFQYFTIAPMHHLSANAGLKRAVQADFLSLTAWQIGMYGFMAFAQLYLFKTLLGTELDAKTPVFWFMMQIAMIVGFIVSYPVNWWLIRSGIKEEM